MAFFPKWELACSFLPLEEWFFWFTAQGGALNSCKWHTSLNQSTHPVNNMILFLWCLGLGFGKDRVKDVCLVTQLFPILTHECVATIGAVFSWPSSPVWPWRNYLPLVLGQINPHRAHLISIDPGVRPGMCKPEVLYCIFTLLLFL